jgi:hypothetical protein
VSADERSRRKVEAQVPEKEHGVASGRRSWTPAVLLGSVVGVVGVLVAVGLVLALLVYFLA